MRINTEDPKPCEAPRVSSSNKSVTAQQNLKFVMTGLSKEDLEFAVIATARLRLNLGGTQRRGPIPSRLMKIPLNPRAFNGGGETFHIDKRS